MSHSVGSDGKLSMSQGLSSSAEGLTVGSDISMEKQVIPNPSAPGPEVIDSGCTVSYIFTRGVAFGMMEETISMIYEFPIVSPAKRQAGASWGRINAITLYADEADLEAVKVGDAIAIEMAPAAVANGTSAPTGAATPGASTPAAAEPKSGAEALAVPSALAALVAAAVFFALE
jgi:hypothetical protein